MSISKVVESLPEVRYRSRGVLRVSGASRVEVWNRVLVGACGLLGKNLDQIQELGHIQFENLRVKAVARSPEVLHERAMQRTRETPTNVRILGPLMNHVRQGPTEWLRNLLEVQLSQRACLGDRKPFAVAQPSLSHDGRVFQVAHPPSPDRAEEADLGSPGSSGDG